MSSINARVPPLRLMAVDTPADGEIPSYQSSSGEFEWVASSSGGAPTDAAYLISFDASIPSELTNAKKIDAGNNISLGTSAGNPVSINVSPSGSAGDFQFRNVSTNVLDAGVLSTNGSNTVTLATGSASNAQFNMTSTGKSITLEVENNHKLTVMGGTESFVFDASSSSGGITFPDGTTQTTAATGSSGTVTVGTYAGNNNLAYFSGATEISNTNNISINAPAGTLDCFGNIEAGNVKIGTGTNKNTVETSSAQDLVLQTNNGTNSGTITIYDGAGQDIEITPNGAGSINLDGLKWPQADGSANQVLQTDGSGVLSFATSGGGGDSDRFPLVTPTVISGYTGLQGQITAGGSSTFDISGTAFYDASFYYPFVSTFTGNLGEIKFNVTSAASSSCAMKVGIYSESSGLPNTLLGSASIDVTTTGDKALTSFSSTISLTKGTQYFIAWVRDTTSVAVSIKAVTAASSALVSTGFGWIPVGTTSQTAFNILVNDEDDLNLPSSVTASTNLSGLGRAIPVFMIK